MVQPNLQKTFEALKSPTILHICWSRNLIIEMINECGAKTLKVNKGPNVLESPKKLGDEVLILGNFDSYQTLVQMDSS